MKIIRAVKRRGSSVEPGGFYSFLKSNTWFPASRLPDKPYLIGQIKTSKEPGSQEAGIPPEILKVDAPDRHLARLAVAVLAAISITWVLLLWIMRP